MATKPRPYRLSPLAVQDLEELYLYTLNMWSRRQADLYYADLIAAFEGLASGARVGRPTDISEGYLKLAVGSHLVFYRATDESIDVIRILHQAMDVGRHLQT